MSEPAVSPDQPTAAPHPVPAVDTVEPQVEPMHPAAALVPAGLALALFALWGHLGAGTAATRWIPGTLFLIGLLATTVIALRRAALPDA